MLVSRYTGRPGFFFGAMFQQALAGWGAEHQLKFLLRLLARKRLIIEFLTTALLFLTNGTTQQDRVPFYKREYTNTVVISDAIVEGGALDPSTIPLTIETRVRDYFKDTPLLIEIAYCESRFRQYGKNGEVLRGEVVPEDIGVMQINAYFHEKAALKLGLDIYSLEGNLAYAKWLYEKEGSQPWQPSAKCWSKYNNELARK